MLHLLNKYVTYTPRRVLSPFRGWGRGGLRTSVTRKAMMAGVLYFC